MSTSTMGWRKRAFELDSKMQTKQHYWFRLESESSRGSASADDTESVYSLQGKETEVVRDTSDTLSDSTEFEVDIEYEIESLSDDDEDMFIIDSSGESEDLVYAAAVVGDSSLETFITDGEDSDNSRQGDSSTGLTDFWVCIQCKSQNDHPQYRFCDKCFQDRKAFYPPRPRRRKKAERNKEKSHSPVKLDVLQSCLSGLSSQDSGISIGSSQEFRSLCLDQIVVPNMDNKPSTSITTTEEEVKNRKRQISESSLSDEYEEQRPRKQARTAKKEESKENSVAKRESDVVKSEEIRTKEQEQVKGPLPECKEICIMCNTNPKNSVFLHGRIAHMCCCYRCAMRTWKAVKRCPICQRKINNVVRVFTT